jgi:hypothetical protein
VRTSRRPAAIARSGLGLVGVALLATGCSLASPATVVEPYQAADGANADLSVPGAGAVRLRDFLLVSAGKDKPGVLVGSVTTNSATPVQIVVSVLSADGSSAIGQATITAKPDQLVQLGSDSAQTVQVAQVPIPPGSTLTLNARTSGGSAEFSLPVVAQQNQYASITPTESATSSSSARSSSTPSPTASSSS